MDVGCKTFQKDKKIHQCELCSREKWSKINCTVSDRRIWMLKHQPLSPHFHSHLCDLDRFFTLTDEHLVTYGSNNSSSLSPKRNVWQPANMCVHTIFRSLYNTYSVNQNLMHHILPSFPFHLWMYNELFYVLWLGDRNKSLVQIPRTLFIETVLLHSEENEKTFAQCWFKVWGHPSIVQ